MKILSLQLYVIVVRAWFVKKQAFKLLQFHMDTEGEEYGEAISTYEIQN